MSEEQRSRRAPSRTWILESAPRWMVVAGVLTGAVIGGASGGIAVAGLDADWVGAVGTWVSALATVGAVLIAYVVFRAERADRAVEQEAAELRSSDDKQRARELRLAGMLRVRAGWGSGTYAGKDESGRRMMNVTNLRLYVHNEATEPALDVVIEYIDEEASHSLRYGQLAPNERHSVEWRPAKYLLLPEDQAAAAVEMEPNLRTTYYMFDQRWLLQGGAGPQPIDEDGYPISGGGTEG